MNFLIGLFYILRKTIHFFYNKINTKNNFYFKIRNILFKKLSNCRNLKKFLIYKRMQIIFFN